MIEASPRRRVGRVWILAALGTLAAGAAVAFAPAMAFASDPTIPTLNGIHYSDYGATLTFTPPSQLTGTAITSYEYEISTDGGSTIAYGPADTTNWANSYGNTGATSSPYTEPYGPSYCQVGTTCAYRIRAVVGGGEYRSPWSAWVTETPLGPAPTLNAVNY